MIKRSIYSKLQEEISNPEILILLGARHVGKTTLLQALDKDCRNKGIKTNFFDLEQPQILARFNLSDEEIQKKITSSGKVIFIDEFQYIANASKIFKAIYDSPTSVKIVCSGSSSLKIHKHLKESLAGRRFLYRIFPLSFHELHSQSKTDLEKYLIYGGMPGLTKTDSEERKQQLLVELLSSYIMKDVKALVKEENLRAFNHLLYLLAENQGALLSIHSIANQIKMSSKTINRYLDILEGTYVNFRIFSYSKNLGNELKKSCKSYFYDIGIRNALLKDFSPFQQRSDKRVLLETFVFLCLQSRLKPNMDLKFWRTKDGEEVDFILLKDRKPFPIEVKSKLNSMQIPKGIRRFLKRYPETKKAIVINEHITDTAAYNSTEVNFLTFEKFANDKAFGMLFEL